MDVHDVAISENIDWVTKSEIKDTADLIVPESNFFASGNINFVRTTLATALAPYCSDHPSLASHSLAESDTSRVMRRSLSLSATSLSRRLTISRIDSRDSLLKTIWESSRLINSGGKTSVTRSRTASVASLVTCPDAVVAPDSARMSLPRFEVRQMIVFYSRVSLSLLWRLHWELTLKSTRRPWLSVSCPSSKICRRIMITSCEIC